MITVMTTKGARLPSAAGAMLCVLTLSACSLLPFPGTGPEPGPGPAPTPEAEGPTAADAEAAIEEYGLTDWDTAVAELGPLTIEAFPDAYREGIPEGSPELLLEDSGFIDRSERTLLAWAEASLIDERMLSAESFDEGAVVLVEALTDLPTSAYSGTSYGDQVVEDMRAGKRTPIFSVGQIFGPAEVENPRFAMLWHLGFGEVPKNVIGEEGVVARTATLNVVASYTVDGMPTVFEREWQLWEDLDTFDSDLEVGYVERHSYLPLTMEICATKANGYITRDPAATESAMAQDVIDMLAGIPETYDEHRLQQQWEESEASAGGEAEEC